MKLTSLVFPFFFLKKQKTKIVSFHALRCYDFGVCGLLSVRLSRSLSVGDPGLPPLSAVLLHGTQKFTFTVTEG